MVSYSRPSNRISLCSKLALLLRYLQSYRSRVNTTSSPTYQQSPDPEHTVKGDAKKQAGYVNNSEEKLCSVVFADAPATTRTLLQLPLPQLMVHPGSQSVKLFGSGTLAPTLQCLLKTRTRSDWQNKNVLPALSRTFTSKSRGCTITFL